MRIDRRAKKWWWPVVGCGILSLLWPFSYLFRLRVFVVHYGAQATFFIGPEYLWLNVGKDDTKSENLTVHFDRNTAHDRDFLGAPMVFTTTNTYTFWFPLWLLVAAAAIFSAAFIASHYRHLARFKPGGCPKCGYDLRATPDRCPECGTSLLPPPSA